MGADACGVQVPGSKEQLAQAQKERQRQGAQGTNLSRRQRENRNGGGRGAGSAEEGVIIKGGRSVRTQAIHHSFV